MKTWKKAILLILSFAIAFGGVMLFAYDYLYKYPTGYLDTLERNDEARYYRIVNQVKIGDGKTLLYFAKSQNGVGMDAHVGTLYSKVPNLIANFFCESTSSYYLPVNSISWGVTSGAEKIHYLFGTTSDENTVKVTITFIKSDEEKMVYETTYANKCYYVVNFDSSWTEFPCHIVGYNKDDGITFQYDGDPIAAGEYTPTSTGKKR